MIQVHDGEGIDHFAPHSPPKEEWMYVEACCETVHSLPYRDDRVQRYRLDFRCPDTAITWFICLRRFRTKWKRIFMREPNGGGTNLAGVRVVGVSRRGNHVYLQTTFDADIDPSLRGRRRTTA